MTLRTNVTKFMVAMMAALFMGLTLLVTVLMLMKFTQSNQAIHFQKLHITSITGPAIKN